jgi:hypothetical protein
MSIDSSKGLLGLGVLLAIGMSLAAYLLGAQTKQIGSGRQSISVKGLAEKPVEADIAEWTVGVHVVEPTFAQALKTTRAALPKLQAFLTAQGFDAATIKASAERVTEHYVQEETKEGLPKTVERGYEGSQALTITTKDLAKVEAAYKAIVQFEADGNPVTYETPLFLVSTLEDVKMSLIGAATENAKARAEEFAKHGGIKVGALRNASQGSFYILPAGASSEVDDYGGAYDKTTIEKTARVVVTIEYAIEH